MIIPRRLAIRVGKPARARAAALVDSANSGKDAAPPSQPRDVPERVRDAPRNLAGLVKMGPFQVGLVARGLGLFQSEEARMRWFSGGVSAIAPEVLEALQAWDAAHLAR